jgi:hypothetical protein
MIFIRFRGPQALTDTSEQLLMAVMSVQRLGPYNILTTIGAVIDMGAPS